MSVRFPSWLVVTMRTRNRHTETTKHGYLCTCHHQSVHCSSPLILWLPTFLHGISAACASCTATRRLHSCSHSSCRHQWGGALYAQCHRPTYNPHPPQSHLLPRRAAHCHVPTVYIQTQARAGWWAPDEHLVCLRRNLYHVLVMT